MTNNVTPAAGHTAGKTRWVIGKLADGSGWDVVRIPDGLVAGTYRFYWEALAALQLGDADRALKSQGAEDGR